MAEQTTKPNKSTPAAILNFIETSPAWAGNDLKELLDEVYAIRGKVEFDVPAGHEPLQPDSPEATEGDSSAVESP